MYLVNMDMISLRMEQDDPDLLGRQVLSLRRNLQASGIRVTPCREVQERSDDLETRSDPAMLYTLALTFMTSGAAVALVNALRATFEAVHNAKLTAKITIGNRSLEVSGEHLSGHEARKVEDILEGWIKGQSKGASAS
jgi:hypothetical protein